MVRTTQGTTTYTHNAFGRRSTRTSGGSEETAHYGDLTDIPIFDTGAGGEIARSYVTAWPQPSSNDDQINNMLENIVNLQNQGQIDQVVGGLVPINPIGMQSGTKDAAGLIEEKTDSQTSYPLADAHGDTTTVTNQSGQLTSSHTYGPWGEDNSPTKLEMGYLGKYLRRTDTDTGLTKMGARKYAPNLGRLTSEDKVLGRSYMGQSWDRHSYVVDNPFRFYDLSGYSTWSEWIVPGLKTGRNMALPWHWGELKEDVQGGYGIIRSYLAKGCNAENLVLGGISLALTGKFAKGLKASEKLAKLMGVPVGPIAEAETMLGRISTEVPKVAFGGLAASFGLYNISKCIQS